jgi:hypothetical protein
MDGLELSTDKRDLAAPDRCDLTLSDFHKISRAAAALRDRWDEKAGLRGMRYAPNDRRARSTKKRRPAMQKISTLPRSGSRIFKERKLTIGLDLGDRSSWYCVLDEAGEIILEHKLATTPDAMRAMR